MNKLAKTTAIFAPLVVLLFWTFSPVLERVFLKDYILLISDRNGRVSVVKFFANFAYIGNTLSMLADFSHDEAK